MTLIDANKFLAYLIFSKNIDGLTCGEVKKAVEMCKVDVLDKIRAEIEDYCKRYNITFDSNISACIDIIDKYREVSE